jgi:hypothetical protein
MSFCGERRLENQNSEWIRSIFELKANVQPSTSSHKEIRRQQNQQAYKSRLEQAPAAISQAPQPPSEIPFVPERIMELGSEFLLPGSSIFQSVRESADNWSGSRFDNKQLLDWDTLPPYPSVVWEGVPPFDSGYEFGRVIDALTGS